MDSKLVIRVSAPDSRFAFQSFGSLSQAKVSDSEFKESYTVIGNASDSAVEATYVPAQSSVIDSKIDTRLNFTPRTLRVLKDVRPFNQTNDTFDVTGSDHTVTQLP